MSLFKQIICDIENNDSDTLKLLDDISKKIDTQNNQYSTIDNVDFTINEELIYGYKVLYQYRNQAIMVKNRHGENVSETLFEIRIISIVQPLNHKIINDSDIKNIISEKVKNNILNTQI